LSPEKKRRLMRQFVEQKHGGQRTATHQAEPWSGAVILRRVQDEKTE